MICDSKIHFRKLEEDDLITMHKWLNTEHVSIWYGKKNTTIDDVKKRYLPRINGQQPTYSYLILFDKIEIGYIQTYLISDYPEYCKYVEPQEPAAGLDLFIGEKNFTHKGLGKHIITKFLKEYVFYLTKTKCCIIGPEPKNEVAIKAYEKVGFRYIKTIKIPDEKESEYLMRIEKDRLIPIKRLQKEDVSEIMEVLKLFFTGESSQQQINDFLSNDKNYLMVYKINNQIVGFAYGYELQRFDGRKNMVYLHQIEVLPDYRNQGLGKKLMEKFMDLCKKKECGKLFLITSKSLKPAVKLYEKTNGKAYNNDDIVFTYEL